MRCRPVFFGPVKIAIKLVNLEKERLSITGSKNLCIHSDASVSTASRIQTNIGKRKRKHKSRNTEKRMRKWQIQEYTNTKRLKRKHKSIQTLRNCASIRVHRQTLKNARARTRVHTNSENTRVHCKHKKNGTEIESNLNANVRKSVRSCPCTCVSQCLYGLFSRLCLRLYLRLSEKSLT